MGLQGANRGSKLSEFPPSHGTSLRMGTLAMGNRWSDY